MSEVRIEYLRPAQIERAQETCPTIFLPIGTIEWHGLHNVTGVDSLKAHELCVQAARMGGGVVHPAHYGAVGGLNEPHTFVFDTEDYIDSTYFQPWIEKWCREAVRNGYRAIVLLTGHYGAGQQIAVRAAATHMSRLLNVPILGTAEYWLATDIHYYGDHAGFFETSLMMHLFPGTVDLTLLGEPPYQGVGGKDPKEFATAEDGKRYADLIVRRMASLAESMPRWTPEQVQTFADAEQAILNAQVRQAAPDGPGWEAWKNVGNGVLDPYPEALVNARFNVIEEIAARL